MPTKNSKRKLIKNDKIAGHRSPENKAINEFLKLPERRLQAEIIEPLLREMGFENVRDNSGVNEKGKDLVATKRSEFGKNRLYAFQIKKKKLIGKVEDSNSLGNLFVQLRQARDEAVVDPTTNLMRSPDVCIFITPFPISPSTWEKFLNLYKELDHQNIEIIDGINLLDLIKRYLPHFLDLFSMEVQYRYQLQRSLDAITESKSAFGLTKELQLENIYVEASLRNAQVEFDQLTEKTLVLHGRRIVSANDLDIQNLKRLADWWGGKIEIEDPPEPESEEEKLEIVELSQRLPARSNKKIGKDLIKRVVKMNIDTLVIEIQKTVRAALIEISKINEKSSKQICTKIAKQFITIQEKYREIKNIDPIFFYWINFGKRDTASEWSIPRISIPSKSLLKFDNNILILGEPGAGKTTLLRRLAQMVPKSSNGSLPIFLPLVLVREASIEALFDSCIEQLESQGYRFKPKSNIMDEFLALLSGGGFQLFLDGLDETGSDAQELLQVINELASRNKKCRIILSCRSTFELPYFRGALELMIKPFNENQLDLFLKKWFSSQPSSLVETKSWLKKNERINISARNPLVAALLCSLFHIGAEMPTTEVELYERRFDLLLGKWEQAKGVRRLPASIRKRYWQFITELAFDLHVLKIRTTSVSEACDTAERFFYSKYHRKPYDMVLDCVQRGVLEFDVHGKLSFGHFTNQEFLVGRWLVIENNLDFILEKIEDIWWYNAIKFYSASKEDISSLIRHAIISGKNDYIIADNLLELSKIAPMTDNNALSDLQM